MCDIQPTLLPALSSSPPNETNRDLPPLPDDDDDDDELNNSLSTSETKVSMNNNQEDLKGNSFKSQVTNDDDNMNDSIRQEIEKEMPQNENMILDISQDPINNHNLTTEPKQMDLRETLYTPQETNDEENNNYTILQMVEIETSQDLTRNYSDNIIKEITQVDPQEDLQKSQEITNENNEVMIESEAPLNESSKNTTESVDSPSLQPLKSILKTSSLSRSTNRVNLGEMEDNENKSAKRLIRRNTKFIRPEDFEEEELGQILRKPVTHCASTSRLIQSSSKTPSKSGSLKVHSSDNLKAWRILGEEPPSSTDHAQMVARPRSNSVCLTHLDVSKEKKKTPPSSVKKSKEGCSIA